MNLPSDRMCRAAEHITRLQAQVREDEKRIERLGQMILERKELLEHLYDFF
ncbi:MAG TPA: hypothetical protein VGN12_30290 [Pirellulales bacterium]|jgi:hypothetical protein